MLLKFYENKIKFMMDLAFKSHDTQKYLLNNYYIELIFYCKRKLIFCPTFGNVPFIKTDGMCNEKRAKFR